MFRAAIILLTLAFTTSASATEVLGRWRTPGKGAGEVELYRCGGAVCGRLVTSAVLRAQPDALDLRNRDAAKRGRKVKGLTILEGFAGGPTLWKGGRIYNPEDGGSYNGEITLEGDVLRLKGCVAAPLCKTQVWTRIR